MPEAVASSHEMVHSLARPAAALTRERAALPSRAVSGMERILLRVGETMGADLVIGRVAGSSDLPTFRQAAEEVVRRHPTLRASVAGAPPRFEFAPAEGAPVSVEVVDAQDEDDEPAWQRAAARETTRPFLLDGGPACRFLLVRSAGASEVHVLIAAPHALVDGRCLLRLLHDLLTAWAAALRGERPGFSPLPVTPAAATLLRHHWLLRAAGPLLRRLWLSDLRSYHARPLLPPRAHAESDGDVASIATFREGSAEGWQRLRAACRAHDVTVGGALLAATWLATARLCAASRGVVPGRIPIDVDVDLRSRMDPQVPDTHVGYYTGIAPVGGAVDPSTDFWVLAARLRRNTARAIRWGLPGLIHLITEPVPDLFDHLTRHGVDRRGGGGTGTLVAVSNVGPYPHDATVGPLHLTGLWGLNGASLLGPAFVCWLRFLEGRLFYDAVGAAPAVDRGQVEQLQDSIFELLEHPPERLTVAGFCSPRLP